MIRTVQLLSFALCLTAAACSSPQPEQEQPAGNFIILTSQQLASEKMELGSADSASFDAKIHFSGQVEPSVKGIAKVYLPIPGIISNILVEPGQEISKGQAVAEITGSECIDLQQQFLSSQAKTMNLQAKYDRARQLFDEKISSLKEFKEVEAEYLSEKATAQALNKKLQLIGISPDQLKEGKMQSSFLLRAPINGKIARLDAVLGSYADANVSLAEIIDSRSYRIRLDIFENDVYQLKENQLIKFNITTNEPSVGTAMLVSVGEMVNPDTKTVNCYAIPDPSSSFDLVANQFLDGDIILRSEKALSLPESAIVKYDQKYFVYIVEKEENDSIYFSKYSIETGRLMNGIYEIKSQLPDKKILIKGAFNL